MGHWGNGANDIQKHLSIYIPFIDYVARVSRSRRSPGERVGTRSGETSSDEVDGNNPLFKVPNSLVTREIWSGDLI